nr:hypothetical protein [Tanacetum cinerariifolium]
MNRPSTSYVDSSINKYNAQYPSREKRWDINANVESNRVSTRQGHRGNLNESGSQERIVNQKGTRESQENVDARSQSFEQDMEIGYEESGPSELTFERLERKFQDEIMRSIKEQGDLEDEEIVRHKERMLEINTQYQERFSSLRVQHAARLGELLRKESEARLNHYQQAAISTHKTERGPTEPRDYDWSMSTEAPRRYGTIPNDSHKLMAIEPQRPYGTMLNDSHRSMPAEPLRPYGSVPNDSHRLIATKPLRPDGSMPNDSHRSMPAEPPRPYGIMATEPPRPYGTMPNDSHRMMTTEPPRPMPNELYREHSQYREAETSRVSEERVPIPYGREEQERGHVASCIECYQKETGASEKEAYNFFSKQVEDAWKVIKRALRPTNVPFPLVSPIINLARVAEATYRGNDGVEFIHLCTYCWHEVPYTNQVSAAPGYSLLEYPVTDLP